MSELQMWLMIVCALPLTVGVGMLLGAGLALRARPIVGPLMDAHRPAQADTHSAAPVTIEGELNR